MLNKIKVILDRFNQEGIIYCHWKSNERLSEFVNGEEDLDLLFYPEDEVRVHSTLLTAGAKKFEALPIGKYENIKDYLVLDTDTGKIIHFHVHFGLDIGEKNVKRFRLPWTSEILENRIKHENVDVYSSSYEHELLLLILRETFRRPPHKIYFTRFRITVEDSINSEFRWLRDRVNNNKLRLLCDRLTPEVGELISRYLNKGITKTLLIETRKKTKALRVSTNTKSALQTEAVLVKYLIRSIWEKIKYKFTGKILNKNRIDPRGGQIIAIIGSDGSGKSTTVENLFDTLNRKLYVVKLYMGNPKEEHSFHPYFLKLIKKLKLFPFWNLYEKLKNIKKAQKIRSEGGIVILDRYPQPAYPGIMDGPMIATYFDSKNILVKMLSRMELKAFEKIFQIKIDVLMKLQVTPEVSSKRGLLSKKIAQRKTKIVNTLTFPNVSSEIQIDTINNGPSSVRTYALNKIWEKLP